MRSAGLRRLAAGLTGISILVASPGWTQARLVGERPAANSEEAGLWAISDKAEAAARTKADLDRDATLTAYVRQVACKVASAHCGEVRVYVMDRPFFNAQMAPNGYMEVWSGLLLRVIDEDQLGFVLGHETSHFTEQHSLMALRASRTRGNVALGLSLALAVAGAAAAAQASTASMANSISQGASTLSDLVYLGAMASLFSFSREQETTADALGAQRASEAGYRSSAGVELWRSLKTEVAASDFPKVRKEDATASVFDTHPLTADRLDALETFARGRPASAVDPGAASRYRAIIRPHLAGWLKDDLRRKDFGETLNLVDRLMAEGEDAGVLGFYKAEAYRQRRSAGDDMLALNAYLAASKAPDAPIEVWRELGDMQVKAGKSADAVGAYKTYLDRAPDAQDAWIVKASLTKASGN